MREYARRAALVLDDSPFARHRRPSAYDLYEIIPDRATNTPVLLTSNPQPMDWYPKPSPGGGEVGPSSESAWHNPPIRQRSGQSSPSLISNGDPTRRSVCLSTDSRSGRMNSSPALGSSPPITK